jgi:predicted MFS family arabinose efflux permease
MRNYWELLRQLRARRLTYSAFPGRIAYGMLYLSIFFKSQDETGSIAKAGYAVGLCALMGAFSAGIRGSIIDRFGQRAPLRILVPIHAALIFTMALTSDYSTILVTAFFMGWVAPPINLSVRPLWKFAIEADQLRTAYAFDTATISFGSVIGPVLATFAATQLSPTYSLITCGILMAIGGISISNLQLLEFWQREIKQETDLALLRIPAIQSLAIERTIVGIGIGAFNIAVPSYAKILGYPERAALVLSALALCTFVGGLLVGVKMQHVSPTRGYLKNYRFYILATLPLAFTSPGLSMVIVAALMGLAIGIQQVFFWEITELVRPPGTAVQALGWLWTFEGTAIAFGSAMSGVIIEALNVPTALAITSITVFLGYFVILASRKRFDAAQQK